MHETEPFDAVIIGVGQAGNPLTTALTEAGWRVAVVERRWVGGTCINDGCTPTKSLIASGRVAYLARRAEAYGLRVEGVAVDWPAVRDRKQAIVESFREGIRNRIEGLERAELIDGEARFVAPDRLEVTLRDGGTRPLTAGHIFINTGGRPAMPPIPGLEGVAPLTSTSIMALDDLPEQLLVLGGGYIGVEFAQLFRRLGSRVTLVQRGPQLLPREDREVADALAEILREDGVELLLDATTRRAERSERGIRLEVEGPEGKREIEGSHLLVAAGRTPNSEALDLGVAGVECDERGYIRVNERLETNVPGIYALGDVTGGPEFTHIAYDDYRVVVDHLLGEGRRTTAARLLPYTLFTDPQLGRIGLTERAAREQGYRVRVATIPMSWVARAIETGETRGLMKAVVDADTDQILGAAILGIEGGEIMSMLQLAMMGRLPASTLRDAIFAHPTLAESLNTLFMQLEGGAAS